MRTSVITRFTKNDRVASGRRRIAVLAATTVLAGGVQVLAASGSAWACSGPYKANNPTVSPEARARHHNGAPVGGFTAPVTASLRAGGSAKIGVEFANFTGADYEDAAPALTLTGNHLRAEDVTVEVMRGGTWMKLGTDDGCGGEAVRVDTSPLLQHLSNGRASRVTFRIGLAADTPKSLNSLSVSTSAWAEVGAPGKTASRTLKVVHPGAEPAAAKPTPAKPAPAKPVKHAAAVPAADKTTAAEKTPAAPGSATAKSPAPQATSAAPATTAPAGTPELAHTGAAGTNTFLATSSAALLALGVGVLLAVRRLRRR